MQSYNIQSSDVAIFWDYENCHASSQVSGYEIVSGIRNVAHRFGPVKYFKAYMEVSDPDTFRSLSLRSELQSSGVSLTDCPHNGRKNVADQMIMVDMLAYAMDHPAPATLILISGDRDFAYAVSILRLRRYDVVVISLPLPGAHISLKSQASVYLDWNAEVMGYTSAQPEGRADSPPAVRNPFNFQSPGAHRTSYLPTPGTPFIKDVKLPSKHDTPPVSGLNKSASYSEDPFSPKGASSEPKVVGPSISIPASTPEPPSKLPGLGERPEVVASPACHGKASQEPEENNVETVKTPVQSTSSPSLPQVVENDSDVNATPAQSTPAASPVCSRAPAVETPQPTPPPESCPPPVASTVCTAVAGASIAATVLPEGNTAEDHSPELIFDEASSKEPSERLNLLSGLPICDDSTPDVHYPPVAPIISRDAAPAEQPSLAHVPPTFRPLIDILLKHSAEGTTQPLRSTVGQELVSSAATIYTQAGVSNFSQFTALAERAKLIQMGKSNGRDWIRLHRDLPTPAAGRKLPTFQSISPSPGASSSTQRTVPPIYQLLVDALRQRRAKGIDRPLRSTIAVDIVAKDNKVFERAGVRRFREFTVLAEKAKIIILGGIDGSAWMSLHPDWH
ncbi:hypothetical protein MSAN_01298500 [Mycena sanguinolenta]|uniref:NYN domain-containing protein n=1 Tax=Mycena sanguinolenta TaxID=230812 RepID=A0A8H6YJR8_9AGAR|nr:hypothetical protein MSAN_01298500 [Mycena sanguinolenta]